VDEVTEMAISEISRKFYTSWIVKCLKFALKTLEVIARIEVDTGLY